MGDDDAGDRGVRRRPPRQCAGVEAVAGEPGPTGLPSSPFEQPEVDVVEREGQRHAQPFDAGRDLASGTAGGGGGGRWDRQHSGEGSEACPGLD